MIIRGARSADADAIATILVHSWQHAYRDLLSADALASLSVEDWLPVWQQRLSTPEQTQTLVAELDDEIIGFASWGPDRNGELSDRMLYSIYMAPIAMGKGVGSSLLRHAEAAMLADGGDRGTLHVLIDNPPTRRFYERPGWQLLPDSEADETFFGITVRTVGYSKHLGAAAT